jgi:hypothetical protein
MPIKNEAHLSRIRKCPCLICGTKNGVEAAHIRYTDIVYGKRQTGKQEKPDDRWTVPLCGEHHRTGKGAQHNHAEAGWWRRHDINPLIIAALLWSHSSSDDLPAMEAVSINCKAICVDPMA